MPRSAPTDLKVDARRMSSEKKNAQINIVENNWIAGIQSIDDTQGTFAVFSKIS